MTAKPNIPYFNDLSGKLSLLALFWALCLWIPAVAQEKGLPMLQNFDAADYGAHSQNFAVLQNEKGILFVANTAGILEYDGISWRLITTANATMVRSLAMGKDGKVYVGTRGEIGYLEPDSIGYHQFVSLVGEIPIEYRGFKDVWHVFQVDGGMAFVADENIFFWRSGKIEVLVAGGRITEAFMINGELAVQLKDKGLYKIKGNGLRPMGASANGENDFRFAADFQGKTWIGSERSGLFSWENNQLRKTHFPIDSLLRRASVNCALVLPNDLIAIGTRQAGIVILNKQGKVVQWINRQSGLNDNFIRNLALDREGGVWVALENGLARFSVNSPISIYDDKLGLEGAVHQIQRHLGTLFFATSAGLFRQQINPAQQLDMSRNPRLITYEPVADIPFACYQLLSTPRGLLVASAGGVFLYNGSTQRLSDDYTFCIYPDDQQNRYFTGGLNSFSAFQFQNGEWTLQEALRGLTSEVTGILKDPEGKIWFQTLSQGLYRQSDPQAAELSFVRYDTATGGLPAMENNALHVVEGQLLATTTKGVLKFDTSKETFVVNEDQWSIDPGHWFGILKLGQNGRLFTVEGNGTNLAYHVMSDSGYTTVRTPFLPIAEFDCRNIFEDTDGAMWFGGPDGAIRFGSTTGKDYDLPFQSLIREIYLKQDSLLFAGNTTGDSTSQSIESYIGKLVLQPNENFIGFRFAALSFESGKPLEFQYKLEGFDENWSLWTTATYKEYTNLDNGSYTFKVRARNVYGQVSETSSFEFKILQPWYEKWWAMIIYLALFGLLVYVVVRIRSIQLEKEKKRLEKEIEERTAEVREQKEEIETQSEVLSAKNRELEKINHMVKSINSELRFEAVLQAIIDETRIVKGADRVAFFILDREDENFLMMTSFGWHLRTGQDNALPASVAEELFSSGAIEVGEDLFFLQEGFQKHQSGKHEIFAESLSAVIMIIRIEDEVEGYLVVESTVQEAAFKDQDFDLMASMKEHIISAFIKSKLLGDLQETLADLKSTQAKLVSQEKMAGLGQLTAGIAHEINNPINFVSANIKPLRRDFADIKEVLEKYGEIEGKESVEDKLEEIKELIEDIDLDYVLGEVDELLDDIANGASRTAEIVKELRDFSRLDEDNVKKANLEEGLDSTLSILRNGYKERIEVIREYGGIPEIDCNAGKLNQVFMNIINNGIQATPGKGTITITTQERGDQVAVTIADTGTGMTDEVKSKIFDPFFTTKDVGKGTGLGMSISFGIIKDHNGTIEVESEVGVGTKFTLLLPKSQESDD